MVHLLHCAALAALSLTARAASAAATTTSAASECPTVLSGKFGKAVTAPGWEAQVIAAGLTRPRGIMFDASGALLVVDWGVGVRRLLFNDLGGTCLSVRNNKTIISDEDLNHSIEQSADGKTLYASTANSVYAWPYDAFRGVVTGANATLVTNMVNQDHVSRTLLLSRRANGSTTLVVSRGSDANIDTDARRVASGHAQIRAFDLGAPPAARGGRPYDYATEGEVVGWGLRNSVGVAEHPATGGLWSVENSADGLTREGADIHQDDPGEELNFHGSLDGSLAGSARLRGANYGYPDCFALWGAGVPGAADLPVGAQFALAPSATLNDTTCADDYVAPRLTFQAHVAPLDLKFTPDGRTAYVTFHGSWNRDVPVGYSVAAVAFSEAGEPVEPPNSTTAAVEILANPDTGRCPYRCFRPVGIALDRRGRVFVSSDTTGEIYVLQRTGAGAASTSAGGTTASATTASATTTAAPTSSPNIAARSARGRPGEGALWWTLVALGLALLGGAFMVAA